MTDPIDAIRARAEKLRKELKHDDAGMTWLKKDSNIQQIADDIDRLLRAHEVMHSRLLAIDKCLKPERCTLCLKHSSFALTEVDRLLASHDKGSPPSGGSRVATGE